jgi:hypothetical protein
VNYKTLAAHNWTTADAEKANERMHRWISAAACSRLVGKRNGATMELAMELGFPEQDTAEQLAKAWKMYRYCKTSEQAADRKMTRELRRRFGYTRFLRLYELWRVYEFSPAVAVDYLEHNGGNIAMEKFVIDVEDPKPEWYRRSERVYADVFKLTTDLDVPEPVRKWAVAGEKLLKGFFNDNSTTT